MLVGVCIEVWESESTCVSMLAGCGACEVRWLRAFAVALAQTSQDVIFRRMLTSCFDDREANSLRNVQLKVGIAFLYDATAKHISCHANSSRFRQSHSL